jgi:uncharacterized protein (TIGR03118 family)
LVVTIPHAGQGVSGPTGLVFNGSSDFDVEAGKPAVFIFASRDGTISAWNPKVNPTVAIEKVKAAPGSVLTGATIAEIRGEHFLFVPDVHLGKIRVFDKNFHEVQLPAEAFDDDRVRNFVPFNIQNIGGHLYVSFAQENQAKNFVNLGSGLGAVDVFALDGQLLQRLETGPLLNAPWGKVLAPTDFGSFSHSILVGQFGSGQILAFDAITGNFQGQRISCDAFCMLRFSAPRGDVTPPHLHRTTDETFLIESGEVEVNLGGELLHGRRVTPSIFPKELPMRQK